MTALLVVLLVLASAVLAIAAFRAGARPSNDRARRRYATSGDSPMFFLDGGSDGDCGAGDAGCDGGGGDGGGGGD